MCASNRFLVTKLLQYSICNTSPLSGIISSIIPLGPWCAMHHWAPFRPTADCWHASNNSCVHPKTFEWKTLLCLTTQQRRHTLWDFSGISILRRFRSEIFSYFLDLSQTTPLFQHSLWDWTPLRQIGSHTPKIVIHINVTFIFLTFIPFHVIWTCLVEETFLINQSWLYAV